MSNCWFFSLFRQKYRVLIWSQNRSRIMLVRFRHEKIIQIRFWLWLLSFGLGYTGEKINFWIFPLFRPTDRGPEPEPESEPHHVGAFPVWKNDAALVLASTPIVPVLYSEKIKNWYNIFVILHYIGPRIVVGAGARPGAASLVQFWHEKWCGSGSGSGSNPVHPIWKHSDAYL
jgi:hypothetical protein